MDPQSIEHDGRGRNVVLGGLMGSGKTTVARVLADRLGFVAVDTDAALAARHGPLVHLFTRPDGDERFRQLEHEEVVDLAARSGQVIATGGRTLLDARNVEELSRTGRIVRLDATDDELLARLEDPGETLRPRLAAATDRRALIESLRAAAPALPGVPAVDTTGRSPEQVAELVVEVLGLR